MRFTCRYVFTLILVCVGGFGIGIDMTITNPLNTVMFVLFNATVPRGLSERDFEWIWSAINAAHFASGLVGTLVVQAICDGFGRKIGLLWTFFTLTFGLALQLVFNYVPRIWIFALGRTIDGFAVVAFYVAYKLLICEVSPKDFRGTALLTGFASTHVGMVGGFILESFWLFGTTTEWYIAYAAALSLSILAMILTLAVEESPRYQLQQLGDTEAASRSFVAYCGFDLMPNPDLTQPRTESWLSFFRNRDNRRMILPTLSAAGVWVFGGSVVALAYSVPFLESCGFGRMMSDSITIAGYLLSILALGSGALLVDRWGRRKIALVVCLFIALAEALLFSLVVAAKLTDNHKHNMNSAIGGTFMLWIALSLLGPGVATIVPVEMFPQVSRAKGLVLFELPSQLLSIGVLQLFLISNTFVPGLGLLALQLVPLLFSTMLLYLTLPETALARLDRVDGLIDEQDSSEMTSLLGGATGE